MADYQKEHGGKPLFGSAPENVDLSLKPRPRFGNGSSFVANSDRESPPLFGGTFVHDKTKTLIKDSYDASEPVMMKFNDNDILLVYLDDNKQRGDLERTELMYMIYYSASDTWTEPKKVCETSDTADFSPNLCDCGDKILLSWSSREITIDPNDNYSELLKNMEIYAVFFNKETETFEEIEKITDDMSYDYHPMAACDRLTGQICLYYLKKQNITNVDDSNDLLNQVQTEVNGAYLMYMIYDDPVDASTGEYHWVRDYYYPGEIDPSLTPEQKAEFINTWKGQRFANLAITSVTPPINNPNISDYAVNFAYMHDVSNDDIENFLSAHGMTRENVVVDDALRADFNAAFDDKLKLYLMVAYVVDKDGDVGTKNDSDVFLAIYDQYDHSSVENIRISNNNAPDNTPKLLKTDTETYLFWSENESMVKMFSISEAKYKATLEDHTMNDLISGNIGAMTTDLMFMGDKITNFVPFIDNDNNIYIAWQENSQNINPKTTGEGEIEFKEDLYVAGLIKSIDNNNEVVKSWSNAVRFTDNQKVNDLPAVAHLNNNKLLLVDNSYNLKSVGNNYKVSNSELQSILMTPASSLDVNVVYPMQLRINNNGSVDYDVKIGLRNTGLYSAKGYDYSGNITYDGSILTSFSGSSNEVIIPGGSASIGGQSINASASEITPNINITLTNEQVHRIDKVKLHLNVIEKNVGDAGLTIERDLFNVNEKFTFATMDDDEVDSYEEGDLRVRQDGDNFTIEGVLVNTGNIDTKGNEKIYVTASDVNGPIYVSDYINLPIREQMQFSIPLDKTKLGKVTMGVKDLCLYVMNDEGKFLSDYAEARFDAMKPYNFKLNNSLEKITLEVGKTLSISATYEPSDRFGKGTILFCTADTTVANIDNGVLTAVNPGNTVLCMTTKEYGGVKNVEVVVLDKNQGGRGNGGVIYSGGGSGGGGGGSRNILGDMSVKTGIPNSWLYDQASDKWYRIGAEGKSIIGWVQELNGAWYFLGYGYSMQEGYTLVNGKWYYFAKSDNEMLGMQRGQLYTNCITPNGWYAGADGSLSEKPASYVIKK